MSVTSLVRSSALLTVFLLGTVAANAGVIDVPNVTIGGNSYRAFQDTTTGLTWLDLDNLPSSVAIILAARMLLGIGD